MDASSDWQDLQQVYLTILRRKSPRGQGHWLAVWSRFIEHPYYQSKARQIALATLRGLSATVPSEKNLLADAMFLLAKRIQQPSDAATIRRVSRDFPSWLHSVLAEDCRLALAQFRDAKDANRCMPPIDGFEADEMFLLAHELIMQFDEPQRSVLLLRLAGWLPREIAQKLHESLSRVERLIESGIAELRKLMRLRRL